MQKAINIKQFNIRYLKISASKVLIINGTDLDFQFSKLND